MFVGVLPSFHSKRALRLTAIGRYWFRKRTRFFMVPIWPDQGVSRRQKSISDRRAGKSRTCISDSIVHERISAADSTEKETVLLLQLAKLFHESLGPSQGWGLQKKCLRKVQPPSEWPQLCLRFMLRNVRLGQSNFFALRVVAHRRRRSKMWSL